jgi:rhodanese-related sulfurtransferase
MRMPKARNVAASLTLALILSAGIASAQFAGLFGPDVPTIEVADITASTGPSSAPANAKNGSSGGKPLLLVDVRSAEEVAVSMIPGAISRDEYERNAQHYADYRIAPYCTVGARSEKYTRNLREKGVDAVNFKGSIIAWVEAGQPLVTPEGESTRRVHTWSRFIGVPEDYEQVFD